MSLLEKFLLFDELEHLVAQLLSALGIEMENIAAQTGVRHIYYIDVLVFLGESMLRIFHTLAPQLALVRDAAYDDRQVGILLITGFIYQISADISNHLLQILVIILCLMTVAFSLVPEHEFDVVSLWQIAQLVVDAGTDILGESLEQALSALVGSHVFGKVFW